MEKRFISWNYIDVATDELAKKIKESNLDIDYIAGLPRGGLIPAVLLSHKLNIPLYTHHGDPSGFKILIVDDICDTGETLSIFKEYSKVVIHNKLSALVQPDFYYELVDKEWIVYPWEQKESETIQDYKIK
jgi:hypoxanthine phosphoribosyltransferase